MDMYKAVEFEKMVLEILSVVGYEIINCTNGQKYDIEAKKIIKRIILSVKFQLKEC